MSDINIVLENRDDIRVAVEEKDINVEVPAGKDGRSLRPRGEWSASAAYAYLDLVSYEGSSYVALKAVPAGTLPTDTSYWMLSAEKGEPGGAVWGNISGDLSDQTDLADALLAKAPVILSNASGSIASFSDGSPAPVTALSVGIDPVQDLHGQDAPYPAGGGKNLVNASDTTVTSQKTIATIELNSGVYSFSCYVKDNSNISGSLKINYTDGGSIKQIIFSAGNNATVKAENITIADDNTSINMIISGSVTGYNYSVSQIQCESGSTATAYAPYENICPISGHTSATVTRTGKNLFFYKWENKNVTGAGVIENDNNHDMYFARVESGKQYTFVVSNENVTTAGLFKEMPTTAGDKTYNNGRLYITGVSSYTVTIPDGVKFIGVRYSKTMTNYIIEEGSTATAYEAPQIQTVTIDLDGTRYGGVIDVLTGEMTVDRAIFVPTSETNWDSGGSSNRYRWKTSIPTQSKSYNVDIDKRISDMFSQSTTVYADNGNIQAFTTNNLSLYVRFADSYYSTAEIVQQTLANHQFVYPLATPFTVQLTPSQMQTLLGENNIWADTGDVSVEYRADTKRFVQGQVTNTAKVTRQMIADSATADGKAPKSLAAGDLIIVGDELRKATANIGNGSAITASNSTTATLADVIKALQ